MDSPSAPFVHLHCHTHYSLLDGASPIPKLVKRAKQHGMNALAITDHGNLHGALEFYATCKNEGINPIIGYEAYIAPGNRRVKDGGTLKENSFHLTLLAQNRTGFKNLVKMASAADNSRKRLTSPAANGVINAAEIAAACCVADDTVRSWRRRHQGPPWIRTGPKIVRYPHDLFLRWLETRLAAPFEVTP